MTRPVPALLTLLLLWASALPAGAGDCDTLLTSGTHALAEELDTAVDDLAACGEAARRAGDPARESEALRLLAELQGLQGRWQDSLRSAERALAAARRTVMPEIEARALSALGDASYFLWRFDDAVRHFGRARDLFQRAGDPLGESHALKNLGLAHVPLGRRDLALLHLEAAMERYPEWRDDELAVSILGNLGTIYWRLGAPRSAQRTLTRALAIARQRGRPDEVSDVLGRLAYLYLDLGRYGEAAELFAEALAAASAAAPAAVLPLLQGAAAAYDGIGDGAAAERARARLLSEHRRTGNRIGTCLALTDLAFSLEGPQPRRAEAMYAEAVELAGEDSPECRWQALAGRSRMARRRGDREAAVADLSAALAAVEVRRLELVSDHDRASLARRTDPSYRTLAELLIQRSRDGGGAADRRLAFGVLERMRAATLSRAMAEARLARGDHPPDAQLRHLARLRAELRSLRSRIGELAADDGELPALRDRLLRRQNELDEHLRNSRRAATVGPPLRPATAAEVSRLLPAGTALVSYLSSEGGAVALVLTPGDLRAVALPVTRDRLAAQVAGFLDLLPDRRHAGWVTVGHRLYRDLVAPWAETLAPDVETVVVVPDRELRSLPFEVLPRDPAARRLLVEDFAIGYAPSATALLLTAGAGSGTADRPTDILILAAPPAAGDPPSDHPLRVLYEEDGHDLTPVHFGAVEARRVARYSGPGGVTLTGKRASEARAKTMDLRRFGALHFATHGLLSDRDPRRSALLLGLDAEGREDGFLQAREIEHLRLDADLVVLSACRTARRGRPAAGGAGVASLSEAFFVAGARSVVGTLWSVEDRPAMRLTTSFYRHLATGKGKAGALRAAKLDMHAAGAPPSHWAGFVLLGEPFGSLPVDRPRRRTALVTGFALVALLLAAGAVRSVRAVALRRGTGRRRPPGNRRQPRS